MVIAGLINQSKKIFTKFDEILYGKPPEVLIEDTHKMIRALLQSDELREFVDKADESGQDCMAFCDAFVKKIVEAVAPIIVPISLRNKSLDASYFRLALHLLGAGEFLFSQYVPDIRIKANPNGLVGMTTSVHAEVKKSAMYDSELKAPLDFMKDMRTQYQTSLGLGSPFPKNTMSHS